ncbi:helix-turn-helix domain-containing protein [Microcella sp.]|uniref:helix-turn-helix domain-containing protein n=1 Tax=Microcella sp. TaxID=1913979 RepID=UPI00256C1747|nr:AraC family transcriptional regulator [Microcella sp.]MBX9471602.1 AraC family transcriptional regulator [Microcella sp.]
MVGHPVPTVLEDVVTALWFLEGAGLRRFEKVLPNPRPHLIVNLSGPYRQLQRGGRETGIELTGPFLAGVQTEYLINENPERLRMLVAEFSADGIGALAELPVGSLVDAVVPGEIVLPGVTSVVELAHDGADAEALLGALAELLERRFRPKAIDPLVRAARTAFEADPAREVAHVAHELGLTSRALSGRFTRRCGLGPKRFADVARFSALLASLSVRDPLPPWSELVAEHGYYDQSHGIHAFTRFAGTSPQRFVEGLREHGLEFASFVPLDDVPVARER